MTSAVLKETRVVVVADPVAFAAHVFGSVSQAVRKLQLSPASFHNYRRTSGVPLSVYRAMAHLRPDRVQRLDEQKVTNNPRPFRITSPVVQRCKRELGPYRRDRTPVPAAAVTMAALEAENATLRAKLATLSSILG